jgi:hypothetical protein
MPTFHLDTIAFPGPGPDPYPSFYMLENLNFFLLLFTAVPVYNVLSFCVIGVLIFNILASTVRYTVKSIA